MNSTDIATLQRQILALITDQPIEGKPSAYIQSVRQSPQLKTLHKIIALWRVYDIESYCPLTAAFLKRQRTFEPHVEAFAAHGYSSPFIEELGMRFLELMAEDPSPYLSSLASFERALLKVKQGDTARHTVAWPCDPYACIAYALGDGAVLPDGQLCTTVIAGDIPGFFQVAGE